MAKKLFRPIQPLVHKKCVFVNGEVYFKSECSGCDLCDQWMPRTVLQNGELIYLARRGPVETI